jgi:hypothetical protein
MWSIARSIIFEASDPGPDSFSLDKLVDAEVTEFGSDTLYRTCVHRDASLFTIPRGAVRAAPLISELATGLENDPEDYPASYPEVSSWQVFDLIEAVALNQSPFYAPPGIEGNVFLAIQNYPAEPESWVNHRLYLLADMARARLRYACFKTNILAESAPEGAIDAELIAYYANSFGLCAPQIGGVLL